MPDLGPYATAVLGAYGVTIAAIAGLVAWLVLRARRVRRELAGLERGRRRSDG
ncbi:MAG: heme exporter protein CcmD [Alphaproteobacteria bacterium]|nr:MAG: heme exporter protein CcmD [Alphaproteobacteria bacterium]